MQRLVPSAVVALASLAACARGTTSAPAVAVVDAASAAAPSSPPLDAAPLAPPTPIASATAAASEKPAAPLRYPAVLAELERRCAPKEPAPTNLEMKTQMDVEGDCLHAAMNRELDRSLLPWKTTDPSRFAAVMREQASFNRWADAACDLAEDSAWIDFQAGTRDDGTNRAVAMLGCRIGVRQERFFYARALAEDDPGAVAARAAAIRATGERSTRDLSTMRAAAAALVAAPAPPADAGDDFPRPLDTAERAAVLARIVAVQDGAAALAKATCADWPALAAAIAADADDAGACETALALYYAAHAGYGSGQ